MPRSEKCFTFIWKIKNMNFCFNETKNLRSPLFSVHVMGGADTKWNLCIRSDSLDFKNGVAFGIVAQDTATSPTQFQFDYEISILADDGSVLHSKISLKNLYKGGYEDWSSALYVRSDEIFFSKTDLFIPDDFITIRYRMWDTQYTISLSERCLATTSFETEIKFSKGSIESFSRLESKEKHRFLVNYSSRYTTFSSLNLCIAADGKLAIEIELSQKNMRLYRYEIYIIDAFENKVKCGQGEVDDSKQHCVPLTFTKEDLEKNKRFYLPFNELTIECVIIYPTGETTDQIDEIEYGFEYQDTLRLISNAKNSIVFSEKQSIENLTALKDDLTTLFMKGDLCDTKLKTATETFPAHTVILSARSPVFKSMFATDMKEKTNNCVNIDDLDADTVRRMLLYMYSGNLDDLEYESSKSLYFAADKYDIVSLLRKCSNFLKQNLLQSNCCDILLIADIHQDKDLKIAVQDFIAENDEAVLLSDEWKHLEKNHAQLSIETPHYLHEKPKKLRAFSAHRVENECMYSNFPKDLHSF